MRALISLLAVLTAVLTLPIAATPALADIFKWVDDNGQTHYSDTPPPNIQNQAKVFAGDRLSTYNTDPAILRSLQQTAAQMHTDNLDRKVERLERELATQRQMQYANATDSSYEQCIADRRVDCDQGYGGSYYYGGVPMFNGRRFPRGSFVPVKFRPHPAPHASRGVGMR
jgi:hypothetical protein